VNGLTAEQLAELSMPYRDMKYGEQEYELAVTLAGIGERTPVPDLGLKDTWERVRDNLAKKVIEQRVVVEATAIAAAEQVLTWAGSNDLHTATFQIPLAILTAMVTNSVIDAMDKNDGHSHGPDHD
jgi:hypothetical protein